VSEADHINGYSSMGTQSGGWYLGGIADNGAGASIWVSVLVR